jgi:precorrin-6x reductase
VIDATHPYAKEATHNIRSACQLLEITYWRLLRKPLPVFGESVTSLEEMTALLNQSDDPVLSTLGSKSVLTLTAVQHFHERIWLRLLPSDTVLSECVQLGFDPEKLIFEKGPFDIKQNLAHIRQSSAKILLTKESGTIGGYPEKAEAAKIAKIRMITLCRPPEAKSGYYEPEIKTMLLRIKENDLR